MSPLLNAVTATGTSCSRSSRFLAVTTMASTVLSASAVGRSGKLGWPPGVEGCAHAGSADIDVMHEKTRS
jgi:hypothetical protein